MDSIYRGLDAQRNSDWTSSRPKAWNLSFSGQKLQNRIWLTGICKRVYLQFYISTVMKKLSSLLFQHGNKTHLTWCRIALKKQNNKACCPSILCVKEISLNSNEGRKWRHNDIWMSFFWKSYQWVKEFSVNQLLFPANFYLD